ncbi:MAG: YdcF family protein [Candidatus Nanopelagicales bacterium]
MSVPVRAPGHAPDRLVVVRTSATGDGSAEEAEPDRGRRRSHPVRRAVVAVLAALGLIAVAGPALAGGDVVLSAGSDDRTRTDAIVVLGAAQYWGDPGPVASARLDHALQLYADGVAPVVVTVGDGRPGDAVTEAAAGRQVLLQAGVPSSRVVAVQRGGDTYSSLRAVADLMADRGWSSATLVSDPAHLARVRRVAESLGIDAHVSAASTGPGTGLTAEYVARETLGLLRFELLTQRSVDPVLPG